MRRLLLAVILVLAVLAPGSPAWAHTRLIAADPAGDAVLTAAPAAVTLRFSQRLNPDFTTIVVSDAARRPVPAAKPAIDGSSGTVTLGHALGNGAYTVAYRVVSSDGHTLQGSYVFTVADPSRPAATSVASSTGTPIRPDSGGPAPWTVIALAGAGLLLVAGGIGAYARRKRRAKARGVV
jgi:MprA protease rhombosortase-interaction domain-containing protein